AGLRRPPLPVRARAEDRRRHHRRAAPPPAARRALARRPDPPRPAGAGAGRRAGAGGVLGGRRGAQPVGPAAVVVEHGRAVPRPRREGLAQGAGVPERPGVPRRRRPRVRRLRGVRAPRDPGAPPAADPAAGLPRDAHPPRRLHRPAGDLRRRRRRHRRIPRPAAGGPGAARQRVGGTRPPGGLHPADARPGGRGVRRRRRGLRLHLL
ncbi:MAG: Type II secretory pathway, pullulanase PulA and related glycosidases, partial [uncultured Nocardioides sp.]